MLLALGVSPRPPPSLFEHISYQMTSPILRKKKRLNAYVVYNVGVTD